MQVETIVSVSKEAFFEKLVELLKTDIDMHTNKKVDTIKEGFSYSKPYRKDKKLNVKFVKYKPGIEYKIKMTIEQMTFYSSYKVSDCEEGTKVVYEETVEPEQKVGFLKLRRKKKQLTNMIHALEDEIIKEEKESVGE